MTYTGQVSKGQRAVACGGALLGLLVVGLGLASGLDLNAVRKASEAISAIALPAPKPAELVSVPVDTTSDKAAGAASAANRHAKAAPVVAPKPKLPPPIHPPVAAAPEPGNGSEASAGATPVAGPGSGAGGRGDGLGAGGSGSGGGGTRPVWRSGTIEDRDYPREARRARVGGEVEVRFTIEATGRVTGCRVSKSSGDAALDATTCRLIEARFRFKPATNAAGVAVASSYGWRQTWWLERR